jgi:hypothetical protein
MTPRSTFDDDLARWLEDGPAQAPAPLLTGIMGAVPTIGQRRRGRLPAWWGRPVLAIAPVAAGVAIAAALGFGALLVATAPRPSGVGGPPPGSPTTAPSPSPFVVAAGPTATTGPSAPPAPASTPSPTPGVAACGPTNIAARITSWEGAAGQRIASVELTNTSPAACTLRAQSRPQLVDGMGRTLIDSGAAGPSPFLTVNPGGRLTTLVEDGNYCGPAPLAPVRIALNLGGGQRIIASPPTPTDATVPPCNGPTLGAYIRMHTWAP